MTEYKDGTPIQRASTEEEFIELSKSKKAGVRLHRREERVPVQSVRERERG